MAVTDSRIVLADDCAGGAYAAVGEVIARLELVSIKSQKWRLVAAAEALSFSFSLVFKLLNRGRCTALPVVVIKKDRVRSQRWSRMIDV